MNPILLNIPFEIETERLTIRCPQAGDGERIHAAIVESEKELRPWMLFLQNNAPVESAEFYEILLRKAHAEWILRENFWMLVFRKGTNELIGSSGLDPKDWRIPSFETGYWFRTSETGKGYAQEALNAITTFGFNVLGAKRIYLRADVRNARSQHLAERCGYACEGILRNSNYSNWGNDGKPADMKLYARTA